MLTVIVTIMGRYICSASSYCENNDNNARSTCSVNCDVKITVRSICSANSYCDNNGEVYVQC